MASHHQQKVVPLHRGPVALHDIPCDVEPPTDYPIGARFVRHVTIEPVSFFDSDLALGLCIGFVGGCFFTVGAAYLWSMFL